MQVVEVLVQSTMNSVQYYFYVVNFNKIQPEVLSSLLLVPKVVARDDRAIEHTTSTTSTPTPVVHMHKVL